MELWRKTLNSVIRTKTKIHLRVSTGVNLRPAVGRQVAQDIRHFLKHRQTVNMDLNNKVAKHRQGVSDQMRIKNCVCVWVCVWYLCVELLTKVGKQILISICCFTVKPHNMIRTLADPVTNKLQDTIEAGLLLTHMQMDSVFQVLLSLCWLLSKTYPSRDAIKPGIIEC